MYTKRQHPAFLIPVVCNKGKSGGQTTLNVRIVTPKRYCLSSLRGNCVVPVCEDAVM